MAERFGAIGSDISLAAGQSVRRNAADNAFEAYTPGVGGGGGDGTFDLDDGDASGGSGTFIFDDGGA